MDVEVNFGRGGFKHIGSIQNGYVKKKKNMNNKKLKAAADLSKDFDLKKRISMISVGTLSYKKIQEGMLILGCVRRITTLYLEVELPGRVFGTLEVGNLSSVYVKYLKESLLNNQIDESADLKKLDALFFVGQVIPTKVISVKRALKTSVFLTIDPGDIYLNINPALCKAGTLLWAAVFSKLDHGYQLDIGKENCRVFLPSESVSGMDNLEIGQTMWCVVKKLQTSSGISTLTVTAIPDEIAKNVQGDTTLNTMLPGMQFSFKITKILKNGIEGKLPNDIVGYVNELYLKQPLQQLQKYKVGETYEARLLYVEPLTNFVYLTLRRIDALHGSVYPIGQNISVTILSKTPGGIYVNLPNNDKGFVSDKRLLKSFNDKANDTVESYVNRKYKKGSVQVAKILSYNVLEHLYICSLEASVVKDSVFNASDLKIGQCVKVVVTKLVEEGLVVKLHVEGRLQGFIQNMHLSDVEYSANIHKKFYVNQKLTVRVWDIDQKGIQFTNKETFVKLNDIIPSYEEVQLDSQYWGLVVCIKTNGDVLVVFHGGVKGYLSNPNTTFFKGQVVFVTVIDKSEGILILSCTAKNEVLTGEEITIGDYTDVVVTDVQNDYLIVTSEKYEIDCKLPMSHLSSNLLLNPTLIGTYRVGEELKNLLCIDKKELPVLSLRESLHFQQANLSIGTFKDIAVGSIVRGFYVSRYQDGVNVLIPLKPISLLQQVPFKNFSSTNSIRNIKFEFHQPIILKVLNVDEKNNALTMTGKLSQIYGEQDMLQIPVNYFESYLHSISQIRTNYNCNSIIANLSIGQLVKYKITKFDLSGCVGSIENTAVQGLVHRRLCPDQMHVGQILEGKILWIDYQRHFVHLVLLESIVKKMSSEQGGNNSMPLKVSQNAKVLLVEKEFVISLLIDSKTDNQLLFLPTFIHENFFTYEISENYELLEVIKVRILRNVDGFLIGLDKEYERSIKKRLLKKNAVHLKSTHCTSDSTKVSNSKSKSIKRKSKAINEHELLKINKVVSSGENMMQVSTEPQKLANGFQNSTILNKTASGKALINTPESGFSSMCKFFSDDSLKYVQNAENTSEDETDNDKVPKRKRKLNAAERSKLARDAEEEIRKIELSNCNIGRDPQNPDQFDKLLIGNPNSSELWAKYIVYYVIQTEFDKARGIARRALKTIDINQSDEKQNIWLILLQLENNHGDKSSFENVFEEAVRSNEPLNVYLKVIKMLAETDKIDEMEEKIKKARSKFRHKTCFWITIADIYYQKKMLKEARDFRGAALKSGLSKFEELNLLIQFGIKEFHYGDVNEGETLFETLLDNNPKRMVVWKTYIEQVTKTGDLDKARRLLKRAYANDLSLKYRKRIIAQYREFELKYGNKDTLAELAELVKQNLDFA